jgi:guanylate kinase
MRIVLITWVSGSWKTTLQNRLLELWWVRPINFTTRKPRDTNIDRVDDEWDYSSKELQEYVFLDYDTYFKKLRSWDFIEHTHYNWNWYGIWWCMPKNKNVCIVVDPIGREQLVRDLTLSWHKVETYFISIDRETQLNRLIERGDDAKAINARKKDFEWFYPSKSCTILDWLDSIEHNLKLIIKEWHSQSA